MATFQNGNRWLLSVERGEGHLYLAILGALEKAIRSGELQPGDQLPPQRMVAEALAVDISTVTRAYGAANRRGWVQGSVGRGTFVSAGALGDDPGLVDLSMNLPPPPAGVSLGALLRDTTHTVVERSDAARLMSYHQGAGSLAQRNAGASWLAPCLGQVDPSRVLVSSGTQTVLAAVISVVARPGARIVVEPLTYPGFKQIAERMGVVLIPCPVDEEGFRPDELDRICRECAPVAIYVVPTMQNPTATTMSLERRRDVARVAQSHHLWIIEDDPYSRLLGTPPPALATFAPTMTYYVATLAKCLSPGLRLAYLVCPAGASVDRIEGSLRAFALMPAPLMGAIVTDWIRNGAAEGLLGAIRQEAVGRRQLARDILPQSSAADAESIHVWLDLPADRNAETLRVSAHARGLSLVTAASFAVEASHRNGVRISLGGPNTRDVLAEALRTVAELLHRTPGAGTLIV